MENKHPSERGRDRDEQEAQERFPETVTWVESEVEPLEMSSQHADEEKKDSKQSESEVGPVRMPSQHAGKECQQPTSSTPDDILPRGLALGEHVFFDILCRLPVNHLVRATYSKYWWRTIRSSQFIKAHMKRNFNRKPKQLLVQTKAHARDVQRSYYFYCDKILERFRQLPSPDCAKLKGEMVGVSEGVVCLI